MALSGDYAYVADSATGLLVINIANPASIPPAKSLDTSGVSRGVAVSGDYAYVADSGSGLQIVNISELQPVLLGPCDTPDLAYAVAVSGNYAYVADGFSGLQIVRLFGE